MTVESLDNKRFTHEGENCYMLLERKIHEKLIAELQPEKLEVKNLSHLHQGHAGDDGSGESHFKIEILSEALNQKSYVARERAVYDVLSEEMQIIHALTIKFLKA